jgi:hypothetical protein
MRDWWLERFTVEEIQEIAAGIWPDGAGSGDPEVTLRRALSST